VAIRLPARRTVVVTAAVVGVLALASGGAVLITSGGNPSGVSASGNGEPAAAPRPAPPVRIAVHALRHGRLHYGHPLVLVATDGRIADAAITDGSGRDVPGAVGTGGQTWRSARPLPPDMTYKVVVQTVATDGTEGTARLRFATTRIGRANVLTATVSPDGGSYGVGMPVVAYFDHDVPLARRAAVEHRFTVTSTSHQFGAWHWMDARTAHWRPARLWKAHATIQVKWDLDQLALGHGVWGDRVAHRTSFRTGTAHVSTVDTANHWMAVRSGGELIRLIPVSTGRPEYASKGGAHIVLSKQPEVIMDSATVGIPKGAPDYYYEKVYWDTRISNGGMFVHAAPWSVANQGVANVSHGCVNVSTANAEWFYYFSQVGDIVNVINSPAQPLLWDPGTADWTISWRSWLASDPAHPDLPASVPTDPALLATVPVGHLSPPAPATSAPPHSTPPATTKPSPKPSPSH
jgi:lipoprotein-anchoring transpeptidase ErfK/SrfK